ncbi:MAG: hypothetical protein SNH88_03605 [Rikenellaceae bacterium]
MTKEIYNERILAAQEELQAIEKRVYIIYAARIVTFFIAIASAVVSFAEVNSTPYIIAAVISIVCFALLVKVDLTLSSRKRYLKHKIDICKGEIDCLGGIYFAREDGDCYRYIDKHLMADFDLVGRGSLFQYLNRSATKIGERRFIENICRPEHTPEEINRRQKAVIELSDKLDFMQDFQIIGKMLGENHNDAELLSEWIESENVDAKRVKILSIATPAIMATWILLYILGATILESITIPIVLNLIISFSQNRTLDREHTQLNKAVKVTEKYTKLISLIERESFSSEPLADAKSKLTTNEIELSGSFAKLSQLLHMFDSRYNLLAVLVLNALFGYNLQLARSLESWRKRSHGKSRDWFEAIATIDSFISLGVFAINNNITTIYPTVAGSSSGFLLDAQALAHPLIAVQERVGNDITITKSPAIIVITGANMAGKSTFLRSIAVNMLLAMNGAPVVAESFRFTPCDIISSIKIQDSLHAKESYFYAEISRLKQIVEHCAIAPRTMVVLDEILRGTNTKDKQLGSLGLLKKLISERSIVFIATHDLVIGELEQELPDIAQNHCFEVELEDDALRFDYKLKRGVSQKLNASYLLHKMGLI